MIDEIKVEERLRWDPSTNRILGLCQEHTEHVGLDFCSMSDVRAVVHGIMCGEIHHASEVCHILLNNVSTIHNLMHVAGDSIFDRNPFGE